MSGIKNTIVRPINIKNRIITFFYVYINAEKNYDLRYQYFLDFDCG